MNKIGRAKRRMSRREFARGGALAAASACLPVALVSERVAAASAAAQTPATEPALTTAAQAEVDAKVSAVIRKYGQFLSDAEKLDVRRLLTEGQKPLEQMRSFAVTGIDNSDQPGNVLRLDPDAGAATTSKTRVLKTPTAKAPAARGTKP